MPLLSGQALGAILVNQDALKVEGDPGLDALKLGHTHGPQVLTIVAVLVLAAPDTRTISLALAQARNVDEHAIAQIDPAGVDDVHGIPAVNVDVVRVDVEKVLLVDDLIRLVVGVVEGVLGAVQVLAQPLQGAVGDLDVEVVVPGHDLAVPPPAQQGAVGEPRLDAVLVQRGEVAADQVAQHEAVLRVGHFLLEVARVVVPELEGAAGLGEVFRRPSLLQRGEAGVEIARVSAQCCCYRGEAPKEERLCGTHCEDVVMEKKCLDAGN